VERQDRQRSPEHPGWRLGTKVPINVYDGDRPVCQCHTKRDAQLIVEAVNAFLQAQQREQKGKTMDEQRLKTTAEAVRVANANYKAVKERRLKMREDLDGVFEEEGRAQQALWKAQQDLLDAAGGDTGSDHDC